jgi:ribosomal protein S18 acetylase RimI-like enzyme
VVRASFANIGEHHDKSPSRVACPSRIADVDRKARAGGVDFSPALLGFCGHGYGRAITLAAAAALQEMGSSSATVCTPSSNVGGVATYVSAGFQKLPDITDFRRTS